MRPRDIPNVHTAADMLDRLVTISDRGIDLERLLAMAPADRPLHLSLVSGLEDAPHQAHARGRVEALEGELAETGPSDKLWFHRRNFHQTLATWGSHPGQGSAKHRTIVSGLQACFERHAHRLATVETFAHVPELARSGLNLRSLLHSWDAGILDDFLLDLEHMGAKTQRRRGLSTSFARYRHVADHDAWRPLMDFLWDHREAPPPPAPRCPLLPLQLVVLDKLAESVVVVLRLPSAKP